jgi:hypothetical protein
MDDVISASIPRVSYTRSTPRVDGALLFNVGFSGGNHFSAVA